MVKNGKSFKKQGQNLNVMLLSLCLFLCLPGRKISHKGNKD